MNAEEIINLIAENNLTIRKLPTEIIETFSYSNYRQGDVIRTSLVKENVSEEKFKELSEKLNWSPNEYFYKENCIYRNYCQRTRIVSETLSGKWMAKKCNSTGETVIWYKSDGIFNTLEEAVLNAIKNGK